METLNIKLRDLNRVSGQEFGRLTGIGQTGIRDGKRNVLWDWKCSCGRLVQLPRSAVKGGNNRSCGCYRHELSVSNLSEFVKDRVKECDLTGKEIGFLTVIEKVGQKDKHYLYRCACVCGKERIAKRSDLIKKSVYPVSCGCRGKGFLDQEQINDSVRYIVTSPDGQEYRVSRLMPFCDLMRLSFTSLINLAEGNCYKSKSGWLCRLVNETEAERVERVKSNKLEINQRCRSEYSARKQLIKT